MTADTIKVVSTPDRRYYVGQEVSLRRITFTSFDVYDIRRIDNEIFVYVWHNYQETLYDRLPLDHVTYMEGRYGDPIEPNEA